VELNSRYINRHDAETAIYCSDGAGAVILGRTEGAGIVASSFFTDSSNYEAVRHRGGGSSFPKMNATFDPSTDFMEINGLATWKQAITHLPSVIRSACAKAETDILSIDFLIFHQANLRLIEYIMGKMKFPLSKTYTNIQEIGNTGAASVAIALSEAVEKGLIKHNDTLVLAAVGAGFNFAANVWKWAIPDTGHHKMGE
jgi:3-oxoacyl-[acyl-carrier-protein] synthase-3